MSTAELIIRVLNAANAHYEEGNSVEEIAQHVRAIHDAYREFKSGGDDLKSAWHKARVVAVERIIVEQEDKARQTTVSAIMESKSNIAPSKANASV